MRKRVKHIAHISIMFLTIFVGAFAINTLCDLEIIDYTSNLEHQHGKHTENDHHTVVVEGGHHVDKDKSQHGSKDHKGHSSESEDDPCCDEIASNLESSLYFSQLDTTLPIVKFFLISVINFDAKLVLSKNQTTSIYHEYDDPPPIYGFGICVVIQSFLI